MASAVDICNLALGHIRAGSINSLDTDNSIQAQQCKLRYPILRDQMLEDTPWGFARSIKPLSQLTDEVFGWAYTYQYPTDCLHMNRLIINFSRVNPNCGKFIAPRYRGMDLPSPAMAPKVEHQILNIDGNRVLVANESDLRIDYRKKVEDTNLFSLNFTMALSHLLASELAVPLVGVDKGKGLRSDELAIYDTYKNTATANVLNEQHYQAPDSDFVTIRG